MIETKTEREAFQVKSKLVSLLSKTGLAKKTASDFTQVCRITDSKYAVGIVALALHSHCLRYRKYKDNESLYDLVRNSAVKAKLSQEDTDFLLTGLV